ncbi:hypothetical protein MKX29_19125 [Cytobacillus sp. FSL R7-0696]|uniref:hypothetical protein n=1 Tax=Cytobacillus sp. FSL R7-0696 TaxID=2921691 RepID=UPI0030F60F16
MAKPSSETVIFYIAGSIFTVLSIGGITFLLTECYQSQTLNGAELWIIMLVSFAVTALCDLELELEKQSDT